jgi:hypothetical protein
LLQETEGQWSDGLGSSCFDRHEEQTGIRIDPSPFDRDRDVRVEQMAGPTPPGQEGRSA